MLQDETREWGQDHEGATHPSRASNPTRSAGQHAPAQGTSKNRARWPEAAYCLQIAFVAEQRRQSMYWSCPKTHGDVMELLPDAVAAQFG